MQINFEMIMFSGEKLKRKFNKLISIGMICEEVDLINMSGEIYIFETPIGAN